MLLTSELRRTEIINLGKNLFFKKKAQTLFMERERVCVGGCRCGCVRER